MEDYELVLKPIYLSKKDILNKMPYLKTERDENFYQITKNQNQYPLPNKLKNLGKKNLTYQNFLDYTYDYNHINEHKIRMPDHLKIKQKYELLLQNESHPFLKKKSHKKVTPLLITGLNTQSNKKYNNIFSTSQKSSENSDIKTKYSSHKYIKVIFLIIIHQIKMILFSLLLKFLKLVFIFMEKLINLQRMIIKMKVLRLLF